MSIQTLTLLIVKVTYPMMQHQPFNQMKTLHISCSLCVQLAARSTSSPSEWTPAVMKTILHVVLMKSARLRTFSLASSCHSDCVCESESFLPLRLNDTLMACFSLHPLLLDPSCLMKAAACEWLMEAFSFYQLQGADEASRNYTLALNLRASFLLHPVRR